MKAKLRVLFLIITGLVLLSTGLSAFADANANAEDKSASVLQLKKMPSFIFDEKGKLTKEAHSTIQSHDLLSRLEYKNGFRIGTNTGGNGTGIACWNKMPSRVFDNNGRLTKEARSTIAGLDFLDYFEYKNDFGMSSANRDYYKISKIVYDRLKQAQGMYYSTQKDMESGIPLLADLGKNAEQVEKMIPDGCRRVQIFYRAPVRDLKKTTSFQMYVDIDLLENKLGYYGGSEHHWLQREIAYLHENFYILGSAIGEVDSYYVRFLSAMLMSDMFKNMTARHGDKAKNSALARIERTDLLFLALGHSGFDKIVALDWDLDADSDFAPSKNLLKRQQSYYTLLRKKYEALKQVLKKDGKDMYHLNNNLEIFPHVRQLIPEYYVDQLTPEEAFLEANYERSDTMPMDSNMVDSLLTAGSFRHSKQSGIPNTVGDAIWGRACRLIDFSRIMPREASGVYKFDAFGNEFHPNVNPEERVRNVKAQQKMLAMAADYCKTSTL